MRSSQFNRAGSRSDRHIYTVVVVMPLARRRFTVDEYDRMAEAGILVEDDRVELLEGEIVEMPAISPLHAACVNGTNGRLTELVRGRAIVSVQNPVRLGAQSEPEPDIALLRPRADRYATAHPGPDDIMLIIEVALTTVLVDRNVKLPIYERAEVRQAWIVNLQEQVIEVYRLGPAGTYGEPEILRDDDRALIDAFPDIALTVRDIFS